MLLLLLQELPIAVVPPHCWSGHIALSERPDSSSLERRKQNSEFRVVGPSVGSTKACSNSKYRQNAADVSEKTGNLDSYRHHIPGIM